MKVQWAMLANAAEVREGLVSVLGGAWDSIAADGPGDDETPAAVLRGTLVMRLMLSREETDREHALEVRVVDADGQVLGRSSGTFTVAQNPALPVGWDQGMVMNLNLTGVRLPRIGPYEVTVHIDNVFHHALAFQVAQRPTG